MEVINSSCWHVAGSVEGKSTDFLVDSGSTYTIVDFKFFKNVHNGNMDELEPIDLTLKSLSGEHLKVHGQINLNLTVGTIVCNFPVKIVSLGDNSTILGLDFMEQFSCILYMGKGTMKMGPHDVILHRKGDTRCARIQLVQNTYIPPKSELIIQGSYKSAHWASQRKYGLIEPTQQGAAKSGLMVAKSLVNMNGNNIPIRIANFGSKGVKLNKSTTLGIVHPINTISDLRNLKMLNQYVGWMTQYRVILW